MSKNMTRKGLAFGAGFALIGSGFVAAPAAAADGIVDGSVTLAPLAGTNYQVRAQDYFELTANFATSAQGSGKNLKFLVTPVANDVKYDIDINGLNTADVSNTGTLISNATLDAASTNAEIITVNTASAHGLVTGDVVVFEGTFAAAGGADGDFVASTDTYTINRSDADTFTFTVGANSDASGAVTATDARVLLEVTGISSTAGDHTVDAVNQLTLKLDSVEGIEDGDTISIGGTFTTKNGEDLTTETPEVLSVDKTAKTVSLKFDGTPEIEATDDFTGGSASIGSGTATLNITESTSLSSRADILSRDRGSVRVTGSTPAYSASTSSFVVDSGVDSNSNDVVLRLVNTSDSLTTTAQVIAWVDNNGDGEINATEVASPTRTVTFVKESDVVGTTTILPATVGESTVKAELNLPGFNLAQMLINDSQTLDSDGDLASVPDSFAEMEFTRQGDTAKVDSASASFDGSENTITFTSVNFNNGGWTDTAASKVAPGTAVDTATDEVIWKVEVSDEVVTIYVGNHDGTDWTASAHGLRVGDKVTTEDTDDVRDWETATAVEITSVPTASTFTYTLAGATDLTTAQIQGDSNATDSLYTVDTYLRDSVENGELTALALLDKDLGTNTTNTGGDDVVAAKATFDVGAKVVGGSGISIVGVASASVSAAGAVLEDTNEATAAVVVEDKDGDPVGAGVDVTITAVKASGIGTMTVNDVAVGTSTKTIYAKTNSDGRVILEVTNTSGADGDRINLTADSQGASQATLSLIWDERVYTLHDLNDSEATAANFSRERTADADGNYTFSFYVNDQFKQVPGDDVRLKVAATGRTVETEILALTDGAATYTVGDGGISTGEIAVAVTFQEQQTSGLWADQTSANDNYVDWAGNGDGDQADVDINYTTSASITMNADGANLPSSTASDLSATATTLSLTEVDQRATADSAAEYTSAQTATIGGGIYKSNGVLDKGAEVTISGGSGLLFQSNEVYSLGSVSTVTTNGTFSVNVFSRVAGVFEVTITSGGVSTTQDVTFTAASGATNSTLTVDMPNLVQASGTFQVTATLKDENGNGINTAAGDMQVTYTGPGIYFGTLPTETDANGNLTFSVLLGANDTGDITVKVDYDANDDGDFTDSNDLSATGEVTVGVNSTQKVNAGSFKGYVAVYALGYEGSRLSAKIGNDWVIVDPIVNNQSANLARVTDFTGAGVDIAVRIYIDRVLIDTIPLTTK